MWIKVKKKSAAGHGFSLLNSSPRIGNTITIVTSQYPLFYDTSFSPSFPSLLPAPSYSAQYLLFISS